MGITAKNFTKKLIEKFRGTLYIPTVEHQIYSTEETVIGSYMGKPLYRKVILRTDNNPFAISDNVDLVISVNGALLQKAGAITPVPYSANKTTNYDNYIVNGFVDANKRYNPQMGASIINAMQTIYYVFLYTKTTDTTTTSKVPYEPLTEYSTEERMIGFWIDGKPIYRKTVEVTVPAGQKTNPAQVNVPLSGWDKIIKIGGYLETDFGGHILPYTWGAGDAVGIDFWANKTSGITMYNSLTMGGVADVYIEYTKTTD